ncbi:VOC family protein [Christensenellaceae bacterium NSJ-44]|jgi:lactoylglutathione lyase|uniref:Aldoketomutase n=1 Tax=Luoshenia tenuis TaxID=2763654 RepID=A0A926HM91_9FIRM|nr:MULTISPECIES: VOC family protein [Clostridia]MBC8528365.1 VOC family protein [Luoshenia tenuis]
MEFVFDHFNINVKDLDAALSFYDEALGLKEARRKTALDGSFIIVYLADKAGTPFRLELTWLRDKTDGYELGDNESHLAMVVDDYSAAHKKHKEMGCICYENPGMGIYFIEDADGYWIEIIPAEHRK